MVTLATDLQKRMEKTKMVLNNINNLPTTPRILQEALDLLNNPMSNNHNLAKSISKDQGLVAKILMIANSPLLGLQRKVTTIEYAILVLGYNEIKNIVSVLSVIESFKNKTDKYLSQKEFWVHSFLTGATSRRLAEDFDFPNEGEAFIAGFLHDLGISVMHKFFHSNFIEILNQVKEQNVTYQEAEINILGMTHQQIGNYLIQRWNFPDQLCDAILNHHNPENSVNSKPLSSLVHLADYMTQKLQIGNTYWDENIQLNVEELELLRIRNMEEADNFILKYEDLLKNQYESIRYFS